MIDYIDDGFRFYKPKVSLMQSYYLGIARIYDRDEYDPPCFIDLRDENGKHIMGYSLFSIHYDGLGLCSISNDLFIEITSKDTMIVEKVEDVI